MWVVNGVLGSSKWSSSGFPLIELGCRFSENAQKLKIQVHFEKLGLV